MPLLLHGGAIGGWGGFGQVCSVTRRTIEMLEDKVKGIGEVVKRMAFYPDYNNMVEIIP